MGSNLPAKAAIQATSLTSLRCEANLVRYRANCGPHNAIDATAPARSSNDGPLRARSDSAIRFAGSCLDCTRGEAGDIVLHEERVDDRYRDRAKQRAGHQLAPIEHVAADQLHDDADRHGAYRALGQEDQGIEKLVLRQREGEDTGGYEARRAQRQEDRPHCLESAGAVDPSRLLELLRNGLEIAEQ